MAAAVVHQRDAADMIFEPLVTDCEAVAECLNLRGVGERSAPQQSQVVVVSGEDAIGRHGDEFAAERMQTKPVKLVGKACFSGESPGTIIAQDGGLAVTELLRITEVIQHEETGRERRKRRKAGSGRSAAGNSSTELSRQPDARTSKVSFAAGNLRLRRPSSRRKAGSGNLTHGNDFQSSSRRRRVPLPCAAPSEPSDTGPSAAAFRAAIRLPPWWPTHIARFAAGGQS